MFFLRINIALTKTQLSGFLIGIIFHFECTMTQWITQMMMFELLCTMFLSLSFCTLCCAKCTSASLCCHITRSTVFSFNETACVSGMFIGLVGFCCESEFDEQYLQSCSYIKPLKLQRQLGFISLWMNYS